LRPFVARHLNITDTSKPADAWLSSDSAFSLENQVIHAHFDLDLKLRVREAAELEAIRVSPVFNRLVISRPAGPKATMGLDPDTHRC